VAAIWYRFRSELRSRWRAWLGLAVLVAANLIALVPGQLAARTRPAIVLRSE
jgi:hypothetical protein